MKDKNRYIIIAMIVFILLGIVAIFVFSHSKKTSVSKQNEYQFSTDTKTDENLKEYTNDSLKKSHCLDSICIEDVKFYYADQKGRIDYFIENRSDRILSGNVKLVFQDQYLIAAYQELLPGSKIKTSSYYTDMQITYKKDYVLQKLTKEEMSKLIVNDK